ncbi:ribonuclease P/MRP protein subunit POP1 [Sporobolomyces koalae]|uniref:ribonuclease P/MRP protein subunit POP1 n=1 Tax=Sporobolomyces koalae TaxID=500713 RepID=UPI00317DC0E7
MSSKRPSDVAVAGADKKRQRVKEQRSIPVQPNTDQAYHRPGGSAQSGNTNMPPTIEVEKFAQARAFEITAMQRSMKTAKEAGTQRAFQSLPRHLRRRAASHNIRRLPLRLRERAKAEVPKDAAKPKKVSRKMLGRHRRVRPGLKARMFAARQRTKLWLGTHVWHAKRMHMIDIWGYRLAEKPTEKAYRSSYRAAFHGAMVHDASYHQYFELAGTKSRLQTLLDKVCDPAQISPTSKRYSSGARECTTNIYDPLETYPRGLIGPATFIWRPLSSLASSTTSSPPDENSRKRVLLVRVHPSVARQTVQAFESARGTKSRPLITMHSEEFVTFEITGNKALEVVKATLKPIKGTDAETRSVWHKLDPAAGPGSVPEGMIIGFEVYDPRLSFPPVRSKSSVDPAAAHDPIIPSARIAEVPLFWNPNHRDKLATPKYKKKDLDARRAENLIPGTRLRPLAHDNRIPILVSQRTLAPAVPTNSKLVSVSQPTASITLTIPSGWSMPFWTSLVYSSPRVAGLRERALSTFEAGLATFPQDYPTTLAYAEHEKRRQVDEQGYWDRRPPAKRPNYDKLGTDSPWNVDFPALLKRHCDDYESGTSKTKTRDLTPFIVPYNLASSLVTSIGKTRTVSTPPNRGTPGSLDRLESDLARNWIDAQKGNRNPEGDDMLSHALVRVRIQPCQRGVPEDLGLVYEIKRENLDTVREKVEHSKRKYVVLASGEGEGAEDLCDKSSVASVIGRITTGTFSLARGEGYGVAVVSFCKYLEMVLRDSSSRPPRNLVAFRNRDGATYRTATLSLMQ